MTPEDESAGQAVSHVLPGRAENPLRKERRGWANAETNRLSVARVSGEELGSLKLVFPAVPESVPLQQMARSHNFL